VKITYIPVAELPSVVMSPDDLKDLIEILTQRFDDGSEFFVSYGRHRKNYVLERPEELASAPGLPRKLLSPKLVCRAGSINSDRQIEIKPGYFKSSLIVQSLDEKWTETTASIVEGWFKKRAAWYSPLRFAFWAILLLCAIVYVVLIFAFAPILSGVRYGGFLLIGVALEFTLLGYNRIFPTLAIKTGKQSWKLTSLTVSNIINGGILIVGLLGLIATVRAVLVPAH